MYTIGDRVGYGTHGVCKVIAFEDRRVDRKTVEYLALEPLDRPGTRYYVPAHNEVALAKLRTLLTPDEMDALLSSVSYRPECWIPHEGLRKNRYRELLSGGDRTEVLSMLVCLYRYKEEVLANGKKFHLSDDNFLNDAEKMIASEIACVLDMDSVQARDHLRKALKVR